MFINLRQDFHGGHRTRVDFFGGEAQFDLQWLGKGLRFMSFHIRGDVEICPTNVEG